MNDENKASKKPSNRITEEQRLHYIGFEVFPGKPKDLFKSDSEKGKLIDAIKARRETGKILRDDCKLLETRVSMGERIVLTVASVIFILALFLPWYSVYNEVVDTGVASEEVVQDETPVGLIDSLGELASQETGDSLEVDSLAAEFAAITENDAEITDSVPPTYETEPVEEIITGHVARKKIERDYTSLSGLGSLVSIGSVIGHIFSGGFVLILTGILFLVYTLACIGLPLFSLYSIYGLKGDPDSVALKLKKNLRLNWWPLVILTAALILSFFGGGYSPETIGQYSSLGDGYGPAAFLGTLSWGVYISMAMSVMLAVKGIEI
jgi:hypothetical protein